MNTLFRISIRAIAIVWFTVACLMTGCESSSSTPEADVVASKFVSVDGSGFQLHDTPYCFVGTNLWYGAYLGASTAFGDIDRLRAELDHMRELGISNVRVLGASEQSPHRYSLADTFRDASSAYNEDLLVGMDVLLDELSRRDMKAVIYLNNFWEWSGGMSTYLSWVNGGNIVDPSDPTHPWPAFADFTAAFYGSEAANGLFRDYIKHLVTRKNTINNRDYADDPTIMSWQLANEPRPGFANSLGRSRLETYYEWISSTAQFIKAFDGNHLVSIGSEGTVGCIRSDECFVSAHAVAGVDYMTFHMWPKNWGWIDANDMAGSLDRTLELAQAYLTKHLAFANDASVPIVLEEFGLERDGGGISTDTSTEFRDKFLSFIYGHVETSLGEGGPFAGTNFWSWGGMGRAQHDDFRWRSGDINYTGDPPQEPQGLNSVFDSDESTLEIIRRHGARLSTIGCGRAPIASDLGN